MKYFITCLVSLLLLSIYGHAQEQEIPSRSDHTQRYGDQRIYASWGYNRESHSLSTVTWQTEYGTITIKDMKAYDRPSPFDPAVYFNPGYISIPQFNARIGWEKKTAKGYWGLELGQDHMKWVMDNSRKYTITGDYTGSLYSLNSDGSAEQITFDQVKATGDATPFAFEYSDGHNYVHASAFYYRNILSKGIFRWDLGIDGGMGLYIPRPHAHLLESDGYYRGDNGRFQVSGFGFHSSVRTRFYFWDRIFLEPALREVAIYNKHSKLYSPIQFTASHKGLVWSTEFFTTLGVVIYKFD